MRDTRWLGTGWVMAAALAAGCGGAKPDDGKAPRFDDATERVVSALSELPAATASASATPARQTAPLSGSLAGAARPFFSWVGPDAAAIQICAEHACQRTVSAFIATGHRGQPPVALPAGVVYWRLITLGAHFSFNVSPTWELFISAGNGANPNATRGLRYDADADGYADAVVREQNFDTSTDLLHVFYGSAAGVSSAREATIALGAADFRGTSMAVAGDVNGDGHGDVAVTDGAGVALYAGSATGIDPTPLSVTPAPVGDNGNAFGRTVASLGDVNGDGYGDMAVGDGFKVVRVFLGGPTGFGPSADWVLDRSADSTTFIRLLTTGDLNGDGYGDLLVTDYTGNGGPQGFRYFGGGAGGLEAASGGTYVQRPNFPSGVAGDVDGDGTVDLVTSEVTALGLFHGGPGFPTAPIQTIPVAARPLPLQLGDFDGDGDADLATHVATPSSEIYFTDDRVDIYAAGPSGLAMTPTQTIPEGSLLADNELNFGLSFGNADFDRDGREDLLVGAPAPNPAPLSGTTASVFVFPGTPAGVSLTPAQRIDRPIGFGYVSASSPTSSF